MSEIFLGEDGVAAIRRKLHVFAASHQPMFPNGETYEQIESDMDAVWEEQLALGSDGMTVAAESLKAGYLAMSSEVNAATEAVQTYLLSNDFRNYYDYRRKLWVGADPRSLSGLFFIAGLKVGVGEMRIAGLARQKYPHEIRAQERHVLLGNTVTLDLSHTDRL